MIKFKEFNKSLKNEELVEEMQNKITLLMYISECEDMINESYDLENITKEQKEMIIEDFTNWLNKIGMKPQKNDGVIDYILQFGKGTGKLIVAAINKDEAKVKEIASGLKKDKILDFLLQLDVLTLGILSTPLDFINAVTGLDLMSSLKDFVKDSEDKLKVFYNSIEGIKDTIKTILKGNRQKNMLKLANSLENKMTHLYK